MQNFYEIGRIWDISMLRNSVVLMSGCKGIACILALQLLNIFKLVPEVCHMCQSWNCCQFSEYSVSKRLLHKTAVRSMENELHVSYTCI